MTFADLTTDVDQRSIIRFLDIPAWPTKLIGQPKVLGFFRISNDLDFKSSGAVQIFDDKHRKASSKGTKISIKLCEILNDPRAAIREYDDGHAAKAFMQRGETAVIGGPPSEGRAKEVEGISWYQEIRFSFQKTGTNSGPHRLTSVQTLHFSGPALKAERVAWDRVEIVSGMCLFNAKILENALSPARVGVDLQRLRSSKATLYEMDYIARSSTTIADLASVVILRSGNRYQELEGQNEGFVINLDIPSSHYYHSIHEKLEKDLCTFEDALQWVDLIQERHDQLSSVFERAIRHELIRRGVTRQACGIRLSSKSNIVSRLIRHALQLRVAVSFDEVLQKLNSQNDPECLGYLLYVFEAMRPALRVAPSHNEPRTKLLVLGVDDSSERRIYSRSQKLSKKVRQSSKSTVDPTLVEVYMSRKVFINQNEAGSNLYLDDPTPGPLLHSPAGAPEHLSEPADVIGAMYGSSFARDLQGLFIGVGL